MGGAMPKLSEVQSAVCSFIRGGPPDALAELIEHDGLAPAARLAIYRNNALITLEAALMASFPIACALTGPRFFSYAANSFIRDNLPAEPCLSEYGATFPEFLASFPACAGLPYLGDVAKLEWAIGRVIRAERGRPIPLATLAGLAGDPAERPLAVDPATRFLRSAYPVDVIWQQHRPGSVPETITIDTGAVHLQVRGADGLFIARLPEASWTLRAAIADGARLGQAAGAALAVDPAFDLPGALAALFAEGLIVGLRETP